MHAALAFTIACFSASSVVVASAVDADPALLRGDSPGMCSTATSFPGGMPNGIQPLKARPVNMMMYSCVCVRRRQVDKSSACTSTRSGLRHMSLARSIGCSLDDAFGPMPGTGVADPSRLNAQQTYALMPGPGTMQVPMNMISAGASLLAQTQFQQQQQQQQHWQQQQQQQQQWLQQQMHQQQQLKPSHNAEAHAQRREARHAQQREKQRATAGRSRRRGKQARGSSSRKGRKARQASTDDDDSSSDDNTSDGGASSGGGSTSTGYSTDECKTVTRAAPSSTTSSAVATYPWSDARAGTVSMQSTVPQSGTPLPLPQFGSTGLSLSDNALGGSSQWMTGLMGVGVHTTGGGPGVGFSPAGVVPQNPMSASFGTGSMMYSRGIPNNGMPAGLMMDPAFDRVTMPPGEAAGTYTDPNTGETFVGFTNAMPEPKVMRERPVIRLGEPNRMLEQLTGESAIARPVPQEHFTDWADVLAGATLPASVYADMARQEGAQRAARETFGTNRESIAGHNDTHWDGYIGTTYVMRPLIDTQTMRDNDEFSTELVTRIPIPSADSGGNNMYMANPAQWGDVMQPAVTVLSEDKVSGGPQRYMVNVEWDKLSLPQGSDRGARATHDAAVTTTVSRGMGHDLQLPGGVAATPHGVVHASWRDATIANGVPVATNPTTVTGAPMPFALSLAAASGGDSVRVSDASPNTAPVSNMGHLFTDIGSAAAAAGTPATDRVYVGDSAALQSAHGAAMTMASLLSTGNGTMVGGATAPAPALGGGNTLRSTRDSAVDAMVAAAMTAYAGAGADSAPGAGASTLLPQASDSGARRAGNDAQAVGMLASAFQQPAQGYQASMAMAPAQTQDRQAAVKDDKSLLHMAGAFMGLSDDVATRTGGANATMTTTRDSGYAGDAATTGADPGQLQMALAGAYTGYSANGTAALGAPDSWRVRDNTPAPAHHSQAGMDGAYTGFMASGGVGVAAAPDSWRARDNTPAPSNHSQAGQAGAYTEHSANGTAALSAPDSWRVRDNTPAPAHHSQAGMDGAYTGFMASGGVGVAAAPDSAHVRDNTPALNNHGLQGLAGTYAGYAANGGVSMGAPDSWRARDDAATHSSQAQRPLATGNTMYGDLGAAVHSIMATAQDGARHSSGVDSQALGTARGQLQHPGGGAGVHDTNTPNLAPASRDGARRGALDSAAVSAQQASQQQMAAMSTLFSMGGAAGQPMAASDRALGRGGGDSGASIAGARQTAVTADGGVGAYPTGMASGVGLAAASDRVNRASMSDGNALQRAMQEFQNAVPSGTVVMGQPAAGSDRAFVSDSAIGVAGRPLMHHSFTMEAYGAGNGAAGAMSTSVRDSGRAHDSSAAPAAQSNNFGFDFTSAMRAGLSTASDAGAKPGHGDSLAAVRGQNMALPDTAAGGVWSLAPSGADTTFANDSRVANTLQLMRGATFDPYGMQAGGGVGGAPLGASDALQRFDSIARPIAVARDASALGLGMAFGGAIAAGSDRYKGTAGQDAVIGTVNAQPDGTLPADGRPTSAMSTLTMASDRIGGLNESVAPPHISTSKTFFWTGQSMGTGNFEFMANEGDKANDADAVSNLMRIDHTTALGNAFAMAHPSTFGLAAPFRHEYKTCERAGLFIENQETKRLFNHPIHKQRNEKAAAHLARSAWHAANRHPVMDVFDASAYESDVANSDAD